MKILYFSRSYTPHDYRFLAAITEARHEAVFLRLQSNGATEKRPFPRGVRLVSGGLKKVISQVKPDLVHAGPLPDCGYLAAKSGFHPLVQMSWGSDLLWSAKRDSGARHRMRVAIKNADVVIGDCKAVRQAATKFGAHTSRIVTFPWGVDLTRFKPVGGDGGIRARLSWQKNFILLHLRAWEPLYDPLTFAKAFVRAARQNTNLRLLMPGNGSLSAKICRIFSQAGIQDQVHQPGQISYNDLPDYYRAADVYVSPSLSDGSSVSLMEALACGLPALVSDIPGNREWVQSNKQGWLFPVKKETALSELILKAAATTQLRKMSKQARKTAKARANWIKNKQGLYKAYKLALEARR